MAAIKSIWRKSAEAANNGVRLAAAAANLAALALAYGCQMKWRQSNLRLRRNIGILAWRG